MDMNKKFADPLEFARMMQTVPEVSNIVKTLIELRYFLEKNNALKGFDASIMGFHVTIAPATKGEG